MGDHRNTELNYLVASAVNLNAVFDKSIAVDHTFDTSTQSKNPYQVMQGRVTLQREKSISTTSPEEYHNQRLIVS